MNLYLKTLIGLLLGVIVAYCGVSVTGAGHGGGSAGISGAAVLLIPLAVFAINRRLMLALILSLVLGLLADFVIIWLSFDEDFYGIGKVWETIPAMLILWSTIWVGWQVWAVVGLCRIRGDPHRELDGA